PSATPTGAPIVGDSCQSSDPQHLCVALKYVPYLDGNGAPVVTSAQAIANVTAINKVWAQCNIGFQIDEFVPANPKDFGFSFQTANLSELDPIRTAFDDDHTLLVVTTGTWNRSGTLGNTGANAWTNMPGSGPYGAILEQPVGTNANIVAHELGHYLNLDHVSNLPQLMNPIIYDTSTQLTATECATARSAVTGYWKKMMR
ncbi:matrixin family metalloprotease, partial [Bdellovibrionota bacterium FG-1]